MNTTLAVSLLRPMVVAGRKDSIARAHIDGEFYVYLSYAGPVLAIDRVDQIITIIRF